ncbi:MAG: hypothetical protein IJU20_07925 [Clostridia bacterium]|nr:hypothetical protein [Clostridia bacterium]
MTIEKAKLDEAIRLNKKYYRTGDKDLLPVLRAAEDAAFGDQKRGIYSLLSAITLTRRDYNTPNCTYYEVLQVLGFEIVDGEEVST